MYIYIQTYTYIFIYLYIANLVARISVWLDSKPSKREIGGAKWKGKEETVEGCGWERESEIRGRWKEEENGLEEESESQRKRGVESR